MERLTDKIYEKTNDVSNLMQNVSNKYGYIEYLSADLGTVKDRLEAVVDEVWEYIEKLNEYEDIGLTPEQLIEIDKLYAELCKELGEYKKLGTLEELKEIIKAAPAAGREGLDGKETP